MQDERQAGYITIAPATLPTQVWTELQQPGMFSTTPQRLDEMPPYVFLDGPNNAPTHVKALRHAAYNVFRDEDDEAASLAGATSLIVGAPGLNNLYLPVELAPLRHLAAQAGASIKAAGHLGQKTIMMVLSNTQRPSPKADWHQDPGKTYLLCSEKVSSVLALHGAALLDKEAVITPETNLYSPLPGMPVSFQTLLHTKPYEMGQSAVGARNEPSAMVVFYELAGNREPHAYQTAAEPIRSRIKALTGQYPRPWSYGF